MASALLGFHLGLVRVRWRDPVEPAAAFGPPSRTTDARMEPPRTGGSGSWMRAAGSSPSSASSTLQAYTLMIIQGSPALTGEWCAAAVTRLRAFHNSTPSQTWARTWRGDRMKSGRPACQATRAMTQTAA
jgi:hypothetical protein